MFVNENVNIGLPKDSRYQVGISNEDVGNIAVEAGVALATPVERANWMYYDIALGCLLDSGIVVHRRLPQVNNVADTLASCDIADPNIDLLTGRGVNLISNDIYTDVVQRMAHSQYWFRLWGQAMRVGEQIPIPQLKKVAGEIAIPHDKNVQWAYNKIVGNYSGQQLWYAEWSLWYTLATAPKANQMPPQNLAQHIDGTPRKPDMQAPFSAPDDDAQPNGRPRLRDPIRG